MAWHFDELSLTHRDSDILWFQSAREYVKVVLQAMGDELFAGYTRYVVDQQRADFARLPVFIRKGLMQPVSRHCRTEPGEEIFCTMSHGSP